MRKSVNYLKVKTINEVDRRTMLDSETKAVEHDHADELRLWLRLLTCTTLIEGAVRSRLRERFDVTLPRIDLMRLMGLHHQIHHRGELVVYLRLLDVPVPIVYGKSFDESPFPQPPAV